MNPLKLFAALTFLPGVLLLVWTAYTVKPGIPPKAPNVTHNYVQIAGFVAVAIGAVLWHFATKKRSGSKS